MSYHTARNQVHIVSFPSTILKIFPWEIDFYCIVHASCKSPVDQAGIRCSLLSKEGIPRLQVSYAIEPTSSSLVSEAMALLLAVQQVNRLAYQRVTFLGYRGELFKSLVLEHEPTDGRIHEAHINDATSIIRYILRIACKNNFRSLLQF